jgi:FHS family glucose/mannose:H+ symporter-like MFS transporter
MMAFIGGFGGIIETVTNAFISDLNPEKASFYVNMTQIYFGIGAVIGPIIAGIVVGIGAKWQLFYFVLGLVSVVLMVLMAIEKVPNRYSDDSISWPIFKGLLMDSRFLLICLCMFLYTGSEIGSWGWMTTFLKGNMGFGIVKSGIAVAAFWLGMTISRFICGYLALIYKDKYIIMILAGFSSLFIFVSGFELGEAMMWFVIIGLGFSFSSQWPLIATFGSRDYPASTGTVFALLVGSGGLGGTIIPFVMGLIGDKYNTHIAAMSPTFFFVAIVVIFAFIDKPRKRLLGHQRGNVV